MNRFCRPFRAWVIAIAMTVALASLPLHTQADAPTPVLTGIDVSVWQGTVDWPSVATSRQFVILKAAGSLSNGTFYTDREFETNYTGATAAGLRVGCYFYTCASTLAGAQADADYLISVLDGRPFDLPVYYDIESTLQDNLTVEERTQMCLAFCQRLAAAGYAPGVYSNYYRLLRLDLDAIRPYASIWVAAYTGSGQAVSERDYSQVGDIWQYSSTGSVTGISGNVDQNVAYVNLSATLSAPATLSAAGTENGIQISGKAVQGATEYRLYRQLGDGDFVYLATLTSLSYTDTTVPIGTTATYRVRAVRQTQQSPVSASVSATRLAAPTARVTDKTNGATIAWKAVSGASLYRIYRAIGNETPQLIGETSLLTFTDYSVPSGQSTAYSVAAVSGSTVSARSAAVTVTVVDE